MAKYTVKILASNPDPKSPGYFVDYDAEDEKGTWAGTIGGWPEDRNMAQFHGTSSRFLLAYQEIEAPTAYGAIYEVRAMYAEALADLMNSGKPGQRLRRRLHA